MESVSVRKLPEAINRELAPDCVRVVLQVFSTPTGDAACPKIRTHHWKVVEVANAKYTSWIGKYASIMDLRKASDRSGFTQLAVPMRCVTEFYDLEEVEKCSDNF